MARRKKVKIFSELKQSLEDALKYETGARVDLRITRFPPSPKTLRPAEIRAIRRRLNASQATFARLINVSTNAVESWEQGIRKPHSAALKLLAIARKRPEVLLEA